jgi:hypothetical protein
MKATFDIESTPGVTVIDDNTHSWVTGTEKPLRHVFLTAVKPDYSVSLDSSGTCDSVAPDRNSTMMRILKPRPVGAVFEGYLDFAKAEERVTAHMTQEQHERARRELGWPMRGTGR